MSRRRFGAIRQLPSGRWQARYRNGAGDLVSARQTFATKRAAAQFVAVVEADQLRGFAIDPRGGRTKVEAWAEEWLRTKRGQRANTLARDRAALAHALSIIGHLPLASVTPMHIRSIVDAIRDAGRSPKTVRTYVGTVSGLFAAAVEADLIQRSPVRPRSLALERVARRHRPTLTPDELQRLADALPSRYRALVLVAGVLGLRWSEAIGLRVGDVDFLRRTLTVSQTVEEVGGRVRVVDLTKSDASRRTMSVPAFLIEGLAAHLADFRAAATSENLIFIGPRGGILRRSFRARVLKPAVRAVGLDDALTFHGLRHVATSLMVASGEHPRVIQARLGHADPALSMGLYAHVPDELDRRAARHLDEMFTARELRADDA